MNINYFASTYLFCIVNVLTAYFTWGIIAEDKKTKIKLLTLIIYKMLVVNPVGLVLTTLNVWNAWGPLVYLFNVILFIWLLRRILEISWERMSVFFVIEFVRELLCDNIPVLIIELTMNYHIQEHMGEQNKYYYLITFAGSLFLLAVSQKYFVRLSKYLKQRAIKYPYFWKAVLGVYIVSSICFTIYSMFNIQYAFINLIKNTIWVVLLVIIGYLILNKKRERNLRLEQENLMLQRKMSLEYYQSVKEHIDLTYKFRDEITGHMEMIDHIVQTASDYSKEAKEYAASLRRQYDKLCSMEYCENFMIDVGISRKVSRCKELGIQTMIDMKEFQSENKEEVTYLEILADLLEFAIAQCMEVKEPEKRFIRLACKTNDTGDWIQLSCAKRSTTGKKQLNSRIKSAGLTELIAKYDGEISMEEKEEALELVVQFS